MAPATGGRDIYNNMWIFTILEIILTPPLQNITTIKQNIFKTVLCAFHIWCFIYGQRVWHLLKTVSRKHNKRNILTSEYEIIFDIVVVNDQNIIFPLPWSLGYSYVSFSWHI